MTNFKPMLAATLDPFNLDIQYPCMASYKLDGVRCIIRNGEAVSRSLKPIPNQLVQNTFGHVNLEGLDGELIAGEPNAKDVFNKTSSVVMSKVDIGKQVKLQGFYDIPVTFHVFDWVPTVAPVNGFFARYKDLTKFLRGKHGLNLVPHQVIHSKEELLAYEAGALSQGFEGVMVRKMHGPYKYGRSTLKEEYLLKLKRFHDGEAVVLDVTHLRHNSNDAIVNGLGYKERSTKKAGMQATKMLGSMTVKDTKTGIVFDVGSGFTEEERIMWWINKPIGRMIKYKSQQAGAKDKPRFPVFMGFRDDEDM
jgi:DNA ligase 1